MTDTVWFPCILTILKVHACLSHIKYSVAALLLGPKRSSYMIALHLALFILPSTLTSFPVNTEGKHPQTASTMFS